MLKDIYEVEYYCPLKFKNMITEDVKSSLDEWRRYNSENFEYNQIKKPSYISKCEDILDNLHI